MLTKTPSRSLSFALILLPIVIFYGFIWRNALGIPFQDDIDGILGVLQDLLKANSFSEKLTIILQQDDEHRVAFDRVVTYCLYLLNGEVNLKTHLLIGCSLILGIFGMIAYAFRKANLPLFALIPVAFFIFQIQYYEGIFWSMIPCQNFAVLFFAFLSIFLVSQGSKWGLALAFLIALIATFSSGNGMLTFVPCLLILGYQRRWKSFFLWGIWMVTSIIFYFHNLTIPSFRPKPSDNLLKYPLTILADFPAFVGQFFDPTTGFSFKIRATVSILAGVILIAWVLFLLWKTWLNLWNKRTAISNTQIFMLGGLILILCTAAVFSLARAGDGLMAVFVSRYKLNVALFMALVYGTILLNVSVSKQKNVFWVGLFIAVFFNIMSYFQGIDKVNNYRKDLITDAFTWQNGQNLPSSPIYFAKKETADETFNFNLKRNTYHFPETVLTNIQNQILQDTLTQKLPENLTLKSQESGDYLTFTSDSFEQGKSQDDGVYIVLKSQKETHVFPVRQHRNGIKFFIFTQQYYAKGFESVSILKQALAIGKYRLGVLVVNGKEKIIRFTNQVVTIEKSLKQ